ncbi:MAG: isoleucine--tRNA ligase [Candidimonas sp.]
MTEKKYTVTTPKTSFSLRAKIADHRKLSVNEYDNKSPKNYILHDGPPYANGNLHIGHILNKMIKDIIVRSQTALGNSVHYRPGWDCHGLPIEWKVEEKYLKDGKKKEENIIEFRNDCRNYAKHWVDIQKEEFSSFGIIGDWDNPYLTMDYPSEAATVAEFHRMVMDGLVYRDERPVMWSPLEMTSLAEAEVEYKKITTTSAYVTFPTKDDPNVQYVCWTTTPWTLIGNEAVAYGDLDYVAIKTETNTYVVARNLVDQFVKNCSIDVSHIDEFEIKETELLRPTKDRYVPLIKGEFVTDTDGTGLVHIAPGHGQDDYKLAKKHNLPIYSVVDDKGLIKSDLYLGGTHVYKTSKEILSTLSDRIVGTVNISHDYPHSWRSKKPIIYRVTPQWFVSVEPLKRPAIDSLNDVKFSPASGYNRLSSMIENRGDWCISRQRLWGVPLMAFVDDNGKILDHTHPKAEKIYQSLVERVAIEGCDFWFSLDPSEYGLEGWNKITDVLDVWFDSGCTHSYAIPPVVADMYVEGTDQHRGWFQSSLLISMANRQRAPFKEVLTHGFVLNEKMEKLSKSDGNAANPVYLLDKYGPDVIRLWVAMTDISGDVRLSDSIFVSVVDHYNRVRNTLRFIMGNLNDNISINPHTIETPLELYILSKAVSTQYEIISHMTHHNYKGAFKAIYDFCDRDLSAFYFDIRKDSLYCDSLNSKKREDCIATLSILYRWLVHWLTPFMPYTVHEANSLTGFDSSDGYKVFDYFAKFWPKTPEWHNVRKIREDTLDVLERAREEGKIRSNLEASPVLIINKDVFEKIKHIDLAEICITSGMRVEFGEKMEIKFAHADGDKCDRCWKYANLNDGLCGRCEGVVKS